MTYLSSRYQPIRTMRLRGASCWSQGSRHGFTVIEVVIAVLLLGILGAVAVPKYQQSVSRHSLEQASRRLIADLQYARHYAKLTGTAQKVIFDPVAGSYTTPGIKDLNHKSLSYTAALSASPYEVNIVSVTFPLNELQFNGFGQAASGSIVLARGSQQMTITIDGATGRATAN